MYADSWYKYRKCNLLYKKYKTKAQTWNSGAYIASVRLDKDKGCDRAESYVRWDEVLYTRAYAIIGNFTRKDGPFTINYVNYGENRAISLPNSLDGRDRAGFVNYFRPSIFSSYAMISPHVSTKTGPTGDVYLRSTAETEYDYENHRIIIHGTEGHMMVNPIDIANEFVALTVSLTHEPADYQESDDLFIEEQEYVDNLIWSSRAVLNNGRLQMSGAFAPDHFHITDNDGVGSKVRLELSVDKIVVDVPKEIDLDEISVNFGIDTGNLGWGISNHFAIHQIENEVQIHAPHVPDFTFDFSLFPNPAQQTISIEAKLPYTDNITISIIDLNGQRVKKLYQGRILANDLFNIQGDLSGLRGQEVYILELSTRRESIRKKVILE